MQILYCSTDEPSSFMKKERNKKKKIIEKVAKLSDYERISHKILQCDKREIKNVRYLYEIRIKQTFFSLLSHQ